MISLTVLFTNPSSRFLSFFWLHKYQ